MSRRGGRGVSSVAAADVLAALWRRWYVTALGLALTACCCVVLAPGQHVFSARANVVFVWPGGVQTDRTDDPSVPVLVNFTEMVRLALANDDSEAMASASFGGSLMGAGVRRGSTVILPNSGGQWSVSYDRPVLSVEAVDSSAQRAQDRAATLVRQIDETARELQDRLGVRQEARVTTTASSAGVDVVDGGTTSGTRLRGLVAVGGLGAFLSALAAAMLDRTVAARRLRPRAAEPKAGAEPRAGADALPVGGLP